MSATEKLSWPTQTDIDEILRRVGEGEEALDKALGWYNARLSLDDAPSLLPAANPPTFADVGVLAQLVSIVKHGARSHAAVQGGSRTASAVYAVRGRGRGRGGQRCRLTRLTKSSDPSRGAAWRLVLSPRRSQPHSGLVVATRRRSRGGSCSARTSAPSGCSRRSDAEARLTAKVRALLTKEHRQELVDDGGTGG